MHQVTESGGARQDLSYDRGDVECFMADAAAEQARLQDEIAAVRAQVRTAEDAAAQHLARSQAELGALVLAVQAELAVLEDEHRAALAALRAAADREVDRLLGAARVEADAVRRAAEELVALVGDHQPAELDRSDAGALTSTASGQDLVDPAHGSERRSLGDLVGVHEASVVGPGDEAEHDEDQDLDHGGDEGLDGDIDGDEGPEGEQPDDEVTDGEPVDARPAAAAGGAGSGWSHDLDRHGTRVQADVG